MSDSLEFALYICMGLSAAAWIYLSLLHDRFWRNGPYIPADLPEPAPWPSVAAIVPARNEADTIGATIASLGEQDYPGAFSIILVDDQSNDDTQARARERDTSARSLNIVAGKPLPDGWSGKMWAVAQGVEFASAQSTLPTYFLLTDADIVHEPSALRTLVKKADHDGLGLVSHMVLLRCKSRWERLLIPPFIYFFKKLYPFDSVNDPRRKTAGAAGGCMLVHRETLKAAGGIHRIKHEIIDDCALARSIKAIKPIWLGQTLQSKSLRRYDHLADIWTMVTRTAFVQLHHSLWLLAGTVLGMTVIYIVPPAAAIGGLVFGSPIVALCGLGIWAVMGMTYFPTARLYNVPILQIAFLPLAAALYTLMTIHSAYMTLVGHGTTWKDRRYGMDVGND